MTVNAEIWSIVPFYQQRADLNDANFQETVRETAFISIQISQALSYTKTSKHYVKELLIQHIDLIALLSHISHELESLCRHKIKSVLNRSTPSYARTMIKKISFFWGLFPKRLKDAKKTSSVGHVVKNNQARHISHRPQLS